MVLKYDLKQCLPSSAELPDADDTPVDNELQNLIPNLLEAILAIAWPNRLDWFFGVDMAVYFEPDKPPIVPDGFLSLGVERFIGEAGRLSYVFWEEDYAAPVLALEVVSKTYGGEYERKKESYAALGIRYYAIYVPNRQMHRRRQPLEIYQLSDGVYQLLDSNLPAGKPIWLPEIGLGLGRDRGTYLGRDREWLYWFDASGKRLPTPEEKAQQAEQQAQQAEQQAQQAEQQAQQAGQRADRLAAKLRELGINPDDI
jgi:Uma2 family endonuclease